MTPGPRMKTDAEKLSAIAARVAEQFRPRERLTPSQWANRHIMIPRGGSNAEPGPYRSARMPWQSAMMDDAVDPTAAEVIWVMAKQAPGKTQCLVNLIGYFMDQQPTGILYVRPTLEMAKYFSQTDLVPTIEESQSLRGLVKPSRSRDSNNTILRKSFPGGALTLCGANSASSLRGPRKRVVLLDELDSYEPNSEGDPVAQADGRAETFFNAVKIKATTPTVKGASRCEPIWEASDKRYWFCPCPRCGQWQTLRWGQLKFEWEVEPKVFQRDTAKAVYVCDNTLCGAELSDVERIAMVMRGEWRPTSPFRGVIGRHLNGLYRVIGRKTAYRTYLHEFAEMFLAAKRDGPLAMLVWENTFLAEWHIQEAERIVDTDLLKRREEYAGIVGGVLVVTAGIDVQGDRVEVTVVGWGQDEESWGIEHRIIPGNPLQTQLWIDLDNYLMASRWTNADGVSLGIASAAVDSGAFTDSVYVFCKPRYARRIYATKGNSQRGQPIVGRMTRYNRRNCPVYLIGADTAKREIYGRLKIETAGPGYMHYTRDHPAGFDAGYFAQLVAEEYRVRYVKGFPIADFTLPAGRHNEALDCRVLAKAALAIIQPNFVALKKLATKGEKPDAAKDEKDNDRGKRPRRASDYGPARMPRRGGWTKGWR